MVVRRNLFNHKRKPRLSTRGEVHKAIFEDWDWIFNIYIQDIIIVIIIIKVGAVGKK